MGRVKFQAFCFIAVHLLLRASGETNAVDFSALSALKSNWKNTPRSWNGTDPCGRRWEGIVCNNSRITSIVLSGLGLVGTLTGDIGQLTELQTLDLSQNKGMTGTIPPAIGKLKNLSELMLIECGFHGPIPEEIGSLTNLVQLSLASNKFDGPIPPSIGNLIDLFLLDFTQNNISGPIPVSNSTSPGLDLLVNTRHFHFGQNQLFGPIPSTLFNSSSQLMHLLLDGNQLSGPIPSTLEQLQHLEVLRLDRNMLTGKIPVDFTKFKNLSELYLCNNQLSGSIPNLTGMNWLTYLDMSNNSFDPSPIPQWFSSLPALTTLLMQRTQLEGSIPPSIFSIPSLETLLMSDNELNGTLSISSNYSRQVELIDLQRNLITGYAAEARYNNSLLLQGNPFCQLIGSANNICRDESMNYSYTTPANNCVQQACSGSKISSPNCKCAEPIVGMLHFRSISFSDLGNSTYYIALEEAIMKAFQDSKLAVDSISLSDPGLNIDDYLNVKLDVFPSGTDRFNRTAFCIITSQLNNISFIKRPYFGPAYFTLISSNYFSEEKNSVNTVLVIGAAVGGAILILLLSLTGIYAIGQRKRAERALQIIDPFASWDKEQGEGSRPEIKGVKSFTFEEIKKFTNNFSPSNLLGAGGYGKVYRGTLANKTLVAIKRAEKGSKQGSAEFKTEIELLSRVHHRNLVCLIGFCYEQGEQMLVYEHISNGTLKDAITGASGIKLSWSRRLKLILDSARGLAYLHELVNPPIIHMDVKSNNILLDDQLVARVSDFGLSKLVVHNDSTQATGVRGTFGYLDPEYCITQEATEKCDVYSFGVIMLEIVTGKHPISHGKHIVSEVRMSVDRPKGIYNLEKIVDPSILSGSEPAGIGKFFDLALSCVSETGDRRPAMGEVVKEIENILQLASKAEKSDSSPLSSKNWASEDRNYFDLMNSNMFEYSGSFPGVQLGHGTSSSSK